MPATYSASTDSRDPAYAWSFGEESGGSGATTSRIFATGTAQVSLTVNDRVYNCTSTASKAVTATVTASSASTENAPGAGSAARDRTAPKITRVKLSRTRITRRRSSRLSFTLSEKATVTVTVNRLRGKKVVARRKIVIKAKRGSNRLTLTAKKLKWRRARYSVRVSARDAAGNRAKTVARSLRVR